MSKIHLPEVFMNTWVFKSIKERIMTGREILTHSYT